jgi:hypothetical protein
MASNSKKTEFRRERKKTTLGRKRKKAMSKLSTPKFPIHPDNNESQTDRSL